jgi:adenosylhomocysteine nucleosidase
MTRVAIIAAMAGELKPLVRGWEHERRDGVDVWRWRFDEGEWQLAATRAFAEVEKDGAITSVISAGWVGALSEDYRPGRAYRITGVVDSQTGERFETAGVVASESEGMIEAHPSDKNKDVARMGHPVGDTAATFPRSQKRDLGHPIGGECLLVTNPKVADAAEKKRLAAAYGAGLVDMEAAAVARLAGMRGIPFYCFKGVSDAFSEDLPDFNRFITPNGQFQTARLLFFVLPRPWHWPALIRMGENSKQASQSLAECVFDFLDERGHIRKRNGYPNIKP